MKRVLFSRGRRYTFRTVRLVQYPPFITCLFKILVRVANKIEKLTRDLLWKGWDEEKKDRLVSWEVVSLCKEK